MFTLTVCPTPIGLGATLMKAYVGSVHAGLCAKAEGIVETASGISNIANIKIAIGLFIVFFRIFFSSFCIKHLAS
jgi:hypothetical protein